MIPGLGRSPGEGNGYPLQYSCLENSKDRGAWQATVHGVTKSWTQLRDFHTHTCILPQVPLPPRLPHNIKQSSLCCTVGLSLSILLSDFIYSLLSLCPLNEFPQNPVPLISGPTAIISFSQSPCLMQEVAPFLQGRGVVDGGAKWRRGGRGP